MLRGRTGSAASGNPLPPASSAEEGAAPPTGRKLGLPPERVIVTVDQHANTSAASIPLALDVAVRDGRIRPGQQVLMEGVGGGFTWSAVLARM